MNGLKVIILEKATKNLCIGNKVIIQDLNTGTTTEINKHRLKEL